jgi:hypothetical protein
MEDEDGQNKQAKEKALRELVDMAKYQGNRVREVREKFERLRDKIVNNINFEDSEHAENMRMNLETIFNYGHSAGEGSETSIALHEQIEIMHKMEKVSTDRDKIQAERDDKAAERDIKALEISERQAKALEQIVTFLRSSR